MNFGSHQPGRAHLQQVRFINGCPRLGHRPFLNSLVFKHAVKNNISVPSHQYMCAKCSFTRFTKSLILKKEETFRMRIANLDYRNKQLYSPETTCMDDHVLDNNELY